MRAITLLVGVVIGLTVAAGCAEKEPGVPSGPMVLEINGARKIVNPSDADIRAALAGLDAKGDAFAVLGPSGLTYVQASGDKKIGFDLEYQEGSVDRHFRAGNGAIPLEDIAAAFIAYRDGRADWKDEFQFDRITW